MVVGLVAKEVGEKVGEEAYEYAKPKAKKYVKKKLNPERPPKEWFKKMKKNLREQYPNYSEERIQKIAGGIWYGNYPQTTRERITRKYESNPLEYISFMALMIALLVNRKEIQSFIKKLGVLI